MFRPMAKGSFRVTICVAAILILCIIAPFGWREYCYWRVKAYVTLRQDDLARTWLGRSLGQYVPDARYFLFRHKLARRSGHLVEANNLLKEAQLYGASAEVLRRERDLTLAQMLEFDTLTYQDWMDLIKDPRDDEPEIAKSFITWANSRFRFDDVGMMLDVWERDYPNDPDPNFLRGKTHAGMSNWRDAEASFRRAMELAPDRADIQYELGLVLKEQNKSDEAMRRFRQAYQLNPDNADAIYQLALTLVTTGDPDTAISLTEDAIKRHPNNLDLIEVLGAAYLGRGESERAAGLLRQVQRARPEDAGLAYRLASALQATGRPDEAKPLFDFVIESKQPILKLGTLSSEMIQHPKDLDVRYEIASITARYVSRAKAKRWYQNILRIDPEHLKTHQDLAQIYRQEGNLMMASQHETKVEELKRRNR